MTTNPETMTSYDEVPYPGFVHAQTCPDRLATVATLMGLQTVDPSACRVLELGCGTGGNLIPMACAFPGSEFLGIDLSAHQIAEGQTVVDNLGCENIELRPQSILDFPDDAGLFDYIIVHGVYSWVPKEVRDRILAIFHRHLSPSGIAFVSYNTYPGWHQRRMIRDMMQFHTREFSEPETRVEQAKTFLKFMTQAVPDNSAYGKSLHEEHAKLENANPSYLFHEQLEDINEPCYFHEFAALLAEHDLQHVADAEVANMTLERWPPEVAEALKQVDDVKREQYLDFMTRRTFRQSLVCHSGIVGNQWIDPERVRKLRVSSIAAAAYRDKGANPRSTFEYTGPGGMTATIGHPLTNAALMHLADAWPRNVAFNDMLTAAYGRLGDSPPNVDSDQWAEDASTVASNIMQAHAVNMVELHTCESPFASIVSRKPEACQLVRHQATSGRRLTTRKHVSTNLDSLTLHLLSQLDGKTPQNELVDRLVTYVTSEDIAIGRDGVRLTDEHEIRTAIDEQIHPNLEKLAELALLVN